jgi:hypothetical protein
MIVSAYMSVTNNMSLLRAVSENFDSAETETPGPDPAFQGTFFNPRNSFDVHEYLVFEETGALEARSTTESMPADLARQHNSRQGLWFCTLEL